MLQPVRATSTLLGTTWAGVPTEAKVTTEGIGTMSAPHKKIAAISLSAALLTGANAVAQAPPAAAATKMYLEQVCVMPAPVGNGVKGNGCNLYGTARWVSVSDRPTMPPDIVSFISSCAAGGAAAVIAAKAEQKVSGTAAKAKGRAALVELAGIAVKGCFEQAVANAITSAAARP